MSGTESSRTLAELARLGTEIISQVELMLAPEEEGKFVAVDVDTGDYEVDKDDSAAVMRLRSRHTAANLWLGRVGQPTAYKMGFRQSWVVL